MSSVMSSVVSGLKNRCECDFPLLLCRSAAIEPSAALQLFTTPFALFALLTLLTQHNGMVSRGGAECADLKWINPDTDDVEMTHHSTDDLARSEPHSPLPLLPVSTITRGPLKNDHRPSTHLTFTADMLAALESISKPTPAPLPAVTEIQQAARNPYPFHSSMKRERDWGGPEEAGL
eukprot:Sspe_Gene.108134::Locus_87292_Transcript_1_1_Confidence_1.000_Length_1721::g.108134::m.108134